MRLEQHQPRPLDAAIWPARKLIGLITALALVCFAVLCYAELRSSLGELAGESARAVDQRPEATPLPLLLPDGRLSNGHGTILEHDFWLARAAQRVQLNKLVL